MTPLHQLSPKRVAIVKPSALGDVVHALPVLSALRQRWPAAHLTWVVNRGYAPLLEGHPDLDAVLPFDRGAGRRGFMAGSLNVLRFGRSLRAAQFDLVIDLQGLLRTGLMTWATRAPRRVGFAAAREGATRFYTDRIDVPDADAIHAVDRYWRVAAALGAGDGPKKFVVPIAESARKQATELLAPFPRPYIMLAVGARWVTKRWPPHEFAAAARSALSRAGGTVVFVGAAEDEPLAREAQSRLSEPALDLCGRTSLGVLAAVLDKADLVFANDTGPLHLAAALGRPVIAPYTCTVVRKHGPYGQFQRTVSATVPCQGSYLKTCSHMSCLPTLPATLLDPIIDEALGSWHRRQTG
ncbi:MAG: glycosyltransferase family 9 protein [Gemmataceae bacterium]|nr:glycosyltransferase family 9 protein [Gemmataceae bacterium]